MSVCDASWDADLICKYFKDSSDKGKKTGGWYRFMDPNGTLDDRAHVFNMLLNEPDHTNPPDVEQSMIPWNQLNAGMVKAFNSRFACGSVVKVAFTKYMGWSGKPIPVRKWNTRGWDGIAWLKKSLTAGYPARAYLQTRHHYVGIVGYRVRGLAMFSSVNEFLIMDPWPGGADTGSTTIKYAGKDTAFLGIAIERNGKIFYDANEHEVTSVESFYPF